MTKFFDVRFMDDVPESVRDTCNRYGTQVIGKMLSEGFNPSTSDLQEIYKTDKTKLEARDWLTETTDIQEYRERWIPLRDLVLEIFVIVLIGIEIGFSWYGETQESKNFTDQQKLLTDLTTNTKTTADNLKNLYTATNDLNALMKNELEQNTRSTHASERSAKASEASSKTAIDALHISERASLVATAKLESEIKPDEVIRFTVVIRNTGKTNASDVRVISGNIAVPIGTSIQKAHDNVFKITSEDKSVALIGAGESVDQKWDAKAKLTEADISLVKDQHWQIYVFSDTTYKDEFGVTHHTHLCTYYDAGLSRLSNCSELNNAD